MPKGDNNRKLNFEIAKAIRIEYITDKSMTYKKLALKYNVSVKTIQQILSNESYKGVK